MKNFIKLIFFLLLINHNCFSQTVGPGLNGGELGMTYQMQDYASLTRLNNSAKGEIITTYFLYNDWQNNCTLIIKGKKLKLNKVNFKIETNEFLLEKGKDSVFSFNKKDIDLITINGVRYKYKDFKNEKKFFEILLERKNGLSFYKGYNIRVLPKSDIGVLNRPYDVKVKEEKFYVSDGESINTIKLKKKKIIKLFKKEKQNSVSKFIKKNKLSYKKVNDIIKIFNYYNNL